MTALDRWLENQASTATGLLPTDPVGELKQLAASVALWITVASASVAKTTQRTVLELTSSTSATVLAAADTSLRTLAPEIRARLDSILEEVRNEIVEDGMNNTITAMLPQLVANHYRSVLPAIAALTDGHRTSAAVTAELLKEVGRLRDAASHFERRWLLEHALSSPNPAARDGASVGLAWLRDPAAAPSVRAAVENERVPQIRTDLEEVLRLLSQPNDDGAASKNHEA